MEWLSVSKELEHHQHEQKRLGQLLEQNRNDLERLADEVEIHQKRQETVNESMESFENQRLKLDEEMLLQEERIEVQKQRVEDISTKLLEQKVALTEAQEKQKNLVENEQRLHREHMECERCIESLLSLGTEGDQRLEKSYSAPGRPSSFGGNPEISRFPHSKIASKNRGKQTIKIFLRVTFLFL